MKIVTSSEARELIASNKPLLIDFYADWCGPCKMIAPVLEELSKQFEGEIEIVKLNVDQEDLGREYGVMSIPNLVAFKDGKVAKQVVGFQPKPMLEQLIKTVIQ